MPEMATDFSQDFSKVFEGFSAPSSVCFAAGSSEQLLVVDRGAHAVKLVGADGTTLATYGEKGEGEGQFKYPRGVCNLPDGGFAVADAENHRIQLFGSDGDFVSAFGEKGCKAGQFAFPHAVAAARKSDSFWPQSETETVLVVADLNNHRIQILQSDGKPLTDFGADKGLQAIAPVSQITTNEDLDCLCYPIKHDGRSSGCLRAPFDVCLTADGHIVVADYGNDRVKLFTSDGTFVRCIGGDPEILSKLEREARGREINREVAAQEDQLRFPSSVCVGSSGSIFVGDSKHGRVAVFDVGGSFLGSAVGGKCGTTGLGLAGGPDGAFAVADAGSGRVCLF